MDKVHQLRNDVYAQELRDNLNVCPKCNHHMRVSARQRLDMILILKTDRKSVLKSALWILSGLWTVKNILTASSSSVFQRGNRCISRTIRNHPRYPAVVAVFEFGFMAGSMGSVVGERFARAVQAAIDNQAAFVCFTASGGARMQEGLFSLMQMAKTTGVIAKLAEHKLPFISVLTDPTMGGVSASFAFMGDVVMAEPKALIGFAGPRVIEQTVREQLPEGFQRSEFLLQKGAIDMIVDRKNLKMEIAKLIALFQKESLDAIE